MRNVTGWNHVEKLMSGIELMHEVWNEYQKGASHTDKPGHDEIAKWYTPKIDSYITRAVRNESLEYVGGNFYIRLSSDGEHFHNGMELYFRRFDGVWVRKAGQSPEIPLNKLILDSVTKLKSEKKIEYDVTNPLEE